MPYTSSRDEGYSKLSRLSSPTSNPPSQCHLKKKKKKKPNHHHPLPLGPSVRWLQWLIHNPEPATYFSPPTWGLGTALVPNLPENVSIYIHAASSIRHGAKTTPDVNRPPPPSSPNKSAWTSSTTTTTTTTASQISSPRLRTRVTCFVSPPPKLLRRKVTWTLPQQ